MRVVIRAPGWRRRYLARRSRSRSQIQRTLASRLSPSTRSRFGPQYPSPITAMPTVEATSSELPVAIGTARSPVIGTVGSVVIGTVVVFNMTYLQTRS